MVGLLCDHAGKVYKQGGIRVKKGTIIHNHWAGDKNPTKYFIYTGISGRYANGINWDGKELSKVSYYKEDLADKTMFEPVGYCNAFDIMKADLKRLLGMGRIVLWGWERTADDEERCFAGYQGIMDYDYCELYSLDDFQKKYGHGIIKCDKPVPMTGNLVNEWADYDTVLVDCQEYEKFVNRGLGRAGR
ncbi:hypothetical protein QE152_g40017 [Popillia japonica]|uniref:Uncharacterized protein n=1 Tax=Popillia japonica TaxID=7064 RepID=A0AAW1HSF8_POPJA